MAFDLLEFRIPFTDETKKNIVGYDFNNDVLYKPKLT